MVHEAPRPGVPLTSVEDHIGSIRPVRSDQFDQFGSISPDP